MIARFEKGPRCPRRTIAKQRLRRITAAALDRQGDGLLVRAAPLATAPERRWVRVGGERNASSPRWANPAAAPCEWAHVMYGGAAVLWKWAKEMGGAAPGIGTFLDSLLWFEVLVELLVPLSRKGLVS